MLYVAALLYVALLLPMSLLIEWATPPATNGPELILQSIYTALLTYPLTLIIFVSIQKIRRTVGA